MHDLAFAGIKGDTESKDGIKGDILLFQEKLECSPSPLCPSRGKVTRSTDGSKDRMGARPHLFRAGTLMPFGPDHFHPLLVCSPTFLRMGRGFYSLDKLSKRFTA